MTPHLDRLVRPILLLILLAGSVPALAAPTPVFYCGQSFRGRGVLVGDLDCTGFGGTGVTIERGRLEMNGFTIRNAAQFGVHCQTTCLIKGPGTITGNGLDGIRTEGWVAVRGVNITNNALDGINARNFSTASRITVSDSTISGNGFNGLESDSSIVLRRSLVTDNAENGVDVGVFACDTAGRLLLFRSTVTGNGTTCSQGSVCADLSSCGRKQRAPKLRSSSRCQRSYMRGSGVPGQSWNICSQD